MEERVEGVPTQQKPVEGLDFQYSLTLCKQETLFFIQFLNSATLNSFSFQCMSKTETTIQTVWICDGLPYLMRPHQDRICLHWRTCKKLKDTDTTL